MVPLHFFICGQYNQKTTGGKITPPPSRLPKTVVKIDTIIGLKQVVPDTAKLAAHCLKCWLRPFEGWPLVQFGPWSHNFCPTIFWKLHYTIVVTVLRIILLTSKETNTIKNNTSAVTEEAQLSQRGRVMLRVVKNFAKSFKIVQGHWKLHHRWVRHV